MIALRSRTGVHILGMITLLIQRANSPISSIDLTLRDDRGFVCAMADGSDEVEQTQSIGHCGVVNLGRRSDQPLICRPPKNQSTRRTISINPRAPPRPAPPYRRYPYITAAAAEQQDEHDNDQNCSHVPPSLRPPTEIWTIAPMKSRRVSMTSSARSPCNAPGGEIVNPWS
jgi:hypothetical protein